jgi:hypothetical protein
MKMRVLSPEIYTKVCKHRGVCIGRERGFQNFLGPVSEDGLLDQKRSLKTNSLEKKQKMQCLGRCGNPKSQFRNKYVILS